MTGAVLAAWLAGVASDPVFLLAAIFVASFLLEDAAIVAGGVLAARMAVDPVAALLVLIAGIVAGDLALHAAGRWAGGWRWVERQRTRAEIGRALQRIERRWWLALVIARAVPGLRLPVHLASGLARVPAVSCALVIAAAAAVWTPALFLLGMAGGSALAAIATPAALVLAGLGVVTLLTLTHVRRRRTPIGEIE